MPTYLLNGDSEARISELIGLDLDVVDWPYQDWHIELSDSDFVPKILGFIFDLEDPDDLMAAFAMLVASYYPSEEVDAAIHRIVQEHPTLLKPIVKYWSIMDKYPLGDEVYSQDENGFSVTLSMRNLLKSEYGIVPRTKMYVVSGKSAVLIGSLLGANLEYLKEDRNYSYVEWMQDYYGARPEYVEKILVFIPNLKDPADVVAAFALLLASYDDYIYRYYDYRSEQTRDEILKQGRDRDVENAMRQIVKSDLEQFRIVIEYWACIEDFEDDKDRWAVTPFARELLKTEYPGTP